jgi:peptidoglycan/xylan/chitin deacetylase (PgdA/CDA1 family)
MQRAPIGSEATIGMVTRYGESTLLREIRSPWIKAVLAVGILLGGTGIGWTARAATSHEPSTVALPAAPTTSVTVVTLGFDDSTADQMQALPLLREMGFSATFYVISGRVGQAGYMTWQQVAEVAAAGHEIGGHTLEHTHLAGETLANLRHQICDDRVALFKKGYAPVSFAYPFGSYDSNASSIARRCGYNSARRTGGLEDQGPFAETIPPKVPYEIKAHSTNYPPKEVLARIEAGITNAQAHGGGWYNIYLHHICDTCTDYSITRSDFAKLLTWLRQRADSGAIVVRTAGQVVGGPVNPPLTAEELLAVGRALEAQKH